MPVVAISCGFKSRLPQSETGDQEGFLSFFVLKKRVFPFRSWDTAEDHGKQRALVQVL